MARRRRKPRAPAVTVFQLLVNLFEQVVVDGDAHSLHICVSEPYEVNTFDSCGGVNYSWPVGVSVIQS